MSDSIVMKKEESDKHNEEETEKKGTGLIKRRRRQLSWEPLDIINKRYELMLRERDNEPVKDYIKDNIVSTCTCIAVKNMYMYSSIIPTHVVCICIGIQ